MATVHNTQPQDYEPQHSMDRMRSTTDVRNALAVTHAMITRKHYRRRQNIDTGAHRQAES